MPEQEPSSSDRVYRGILRALYEGQLVPGQRLVEPELMRQFLVGRGTIREVLNRLGAAGIVTLIRHRGAVVRMLSRAEVSEVLEIVDALMRLAARRAAERIRLHNNRVQIERVDIALRAFERQDDMPGFLAARDDYYRTLFRLSGNRELPRLFPSMLVNLMRRQLRNFGRAGDAMQFGDYPALTKAVLSGKGDRAEEAAHLHVQHTVDAISRLPERAFAPGADADMLLAANA